MGEELLVAGHDLDRVTDALQPLLRDLLVGDLLAEAVEVHTAVGLGVTVGRQCVVGAGGIVACALWRIVS